MRWPPPALVVIIASLCVTACGPLRTEVRGVRRDRAGYVAAARPGNRDPVDRMRAAIDALRRKREARRPAATPPASDEASRDQPVALVHPLPLIRRPLRDRIVGTSGTWTVVQTTQPASGPTPAVPVAPSVAVRRRWDRVAPPLLALGLALGAGGGWLLARRTRSRRGVRSL